MERIVEDGVRIYEGKHTTSFQVYIKGSYITYPTFNEAKQAKLEAYSNKGYFNDNPTVSEYMDSWLKDSQKKESTKARYASNVKIIKQHIGQKRVNQLVSDNFRFIYDLKLSANSKNSILNTMKSVCSKAFKEGRIESNYCASLEKPLGANATKDRTPLQPGEVFTKNHALNTSDVTEILRYLDNKATYLPMYLMSKTGLRIGECLALRFRDVDLKAGTIDIRHTLTAKGELTPPKTKRSRATISIDQDLVNLLREQRGKAMSDLNSPYYDWFVFGDKDTPVRTNTFTQRLQSDLKLTRFRALSAHHMRHYFGSYLLDSGLSLGKVAAALRDDQATVVKTYSHVINEQNLERVNINGSY